MSELTSYALSHQEFLYGVVSGYALSHVPQLVGFLFHQAIRVPIIRQAILANPERSKQIIAEIEKELEKEIDIEAAKPQGEPK